MNSGNRDEDDVVMTWAVRTSDPDFDDWAGFQSWLDDDAGRSRRYDEVMLAVQIGEAAVRDAAAISPPPDAVVVTFTGRRRIGRAALVWGGGGVIAAGIAAAFFAAPLAPRPDLYDVAAPPRGTRVLVLADGSRIVLASGARLRLDRARPRFAAVERGRAMFVVRHDPAAPFLVSAGGHAFVDAGTAFEVRLEGVRTRIAVAAGRVIADRDDATISLAPGEAAAFEGKGIGIVSRVDPSTIGRWRHGRLAYRDAPLLEVADDLGAMLGVAILVAPDLTRRRFSGTIVAQGLANRPDAVAAMLDVRLTRGDGGWELHSR